MSGDLLSLSWLEFIYYSIREHFNITTVIFVLTNKLIPPYMVLI